MSGMDGRRACAAWMDLQVVPSAAVTTMRCPSGAAGSDARAAITACWALVLGRFSHTDEVLLGVELALGSHKQISVTLSCDETLGELAAGLAVALANAADADGQQRAHSLLLFARGAAWDAAPHSGCGDGLVCLFRIDGGLLADMVIRYDGQRHDSAWIGALARHFCSLLASFPHASSVGRVDLLDAAQRERILHEWNATERDYPFEQCLHWLFEEQATRTPDAVAAEFEAASMSYAELEARSARLAQRLLQLGAGRGVLIPLYAERSLDMVVGILAILKTGAAYVPVDPGFPAAHTRQVLADCEPCIIVAQRRFLGAIEAGMATVAVLEDMGADVAAPRRAGDPRGVACVMYTSGSTGTAKGTLISHRSLVNNILWLQDHWPLGAHDRLLQKTPFTFDVAIKEFLWPLATGARVVLARPRGHLDMDYLARLIAERGITVCHFVPSMLQRFLDAPESPSCSSVKLVMCGAEILPPRLKQRFFERLDAKLLHLYGPTEAAISVTGWECRRGAESGAVVPLGRPMANVQIYLLDRFGNPVPPWVPGDIHIGGVAVADGYLSRPELTRERFVPDRHTRRSGAGPLYRTGDLARYRDDGTIEFIGRADQQVKIHGARVELRQIEVTLNMHEQLKRTAVCARTDRQGDTRLIAYVIAEQDSLLSIASLRAYCAERLPAFMIPSAFVFLDEMPLLSNCKVDYSMLPQIG